MALAWEQRGEAPHVVVAERYELRGVIGGGRAGVVHRALDRRLGRMVALKTLRTQDPDALYRLKREFRTLAGLAHVNLVSFFDLVVDDHDRFFTMELIDGVDFVEAFRARMARGERPDDVFRDLRDALLQLAAGLDALHRRGILHRDIKPANVLIAGDGRVVLLDFGLAMESAASADERAAGTMGYLAPEQLSGRGASVAGDWFSVGAMLYETLTGRMPFEDRALLDLLAGLVQVPPAPRTLARGTPADLDALALALLDRDPLERPVGGAVVARLTQRPRRTADAAPPLDVRPPLVGRDAEAAELDAALRASRRAPFTLRVVGPSGIGKSALIEDFVARAAERDGALVLAARCHPHEAMPFRALDGAIDALTRHLARLDDGALAALLPDDVAAARRVFPVLGRVPRIARGIADGGADVDPIKGRRAAFRALRELFARLAARQPLVLWIDDVQWGDLDSAALLRELLRAPDPPPILLLLSARADGAADAVLEALRVRAPDAGEPSGERTLELGPLPRDVAAALARAVLGRDDDDARSAAARIADESHGSPLFAVELARHASAAREAGATAPSAEPAGLGEVVGARVAALPPLAREVLELVAVAGRPLATALVQHALDPGVDPRPSVALLRTQSLVRALPSGDDVADAIYHDRIRETVLALLPPATARARHLALAQALERATDLDPRLLVHHYEQAGDVARAAELALAAGRRAAADLAFHQAAELYARARDLGTTSVPRSVLEARIGLMLSYAGRASEAAARYEAAADAAEPGAPTDPRRSALRRRAAELYLRTGLYEPGIAALRRSLGDSGVRYPHNPSAALLSILLHRVKLGLRRRFAAWRDVAPTASALERERLEIYWSAGVGLSLFDIVRASDFQLRHALLAQRVGDPRHRARALATEAMTLVWEGGARNRRRSEHILGEASRVAATVGDPRIEVQTLVTRAAIAFVDRRYREALRLCDRGAHLCATRHVGTTWEIANLELCAVSTLACLGDLARMRTRLLEQMQRAADRGDLYSEISLRIGFQTVAWLAADELDEARRQVTHARRAATLAPFQEYCAVFSEAHCDLYAGEPEHAWARIRAAWPLFRRNFLLNIQGVRVDLLDLRARCALALLATRDGTPRRRRGLSRVVRTALRRLSRERVAWVRPVVLALRAAQAWQDGDRVATTAHLAGAAASFDALDMQAHAAAARLHLACAGAGDATGCADELRRLGVAEPERFAALLLPGTATTARTV